MDNPNKRLDIPDVVEPRPNFVSIGRFDGPQRTCRRHQHGTWEIVLYTAGTGTAYIGDRLVRFEPGVVICMPPHVPHAEVSRGGYGNFHTHVRSLPWRTDAFPVVPARDGQALRQLTELLHQEYALRRPGWERVTEALLEAQLAYLERHWPESAPDPAADLRRRIEAQSALPGFDVAALLGQGEVCAGHLIRLFRQRYGCTPRAFDRRLRVRRAQRLLAAGYPVKVAAAELGFADSAYFSRWFRAGTGMAPSDWRAAAPRRSGA